MVTTARNPPRVRHQQLRLCTASPPPERYWPSPTPRTEIVRETAINGGRRSATVGAPVPVFQPMIEFLGQAGRRFVRRSTQRLPLRAIRRPVGRHSPAEATGARRCGDRELTGIVPTPLRRVFCARSWGPSGIRGSCLAPMRRPRTSRGRRTIVDHDLPIAEELGQRRTALLLG